MGAHRLAGLVVTGFTVVTVVAVLANAGLFEGERVARGVRNIGTFVTEMVPPDLEGGLLRTLLRSLWETVQMAWAGTVLGAAAALPLALLATETLVGRWAARPVRAVLAAVRTIPSILWAVFFVVIVGLGPAAGILALAAYTTGYLGKLFYEALEAVDTEVLDAVRSTGAGRLQVARHAAVPEAANSILSQSLFAFEYNVRASSILGLVGAGGIGFYLLRFLELFEYQKLATAIVLLFGLVVLVDAVSRVVRGRFIQRVRS